MLNKWESSEEDMNSEEEGSNLSKAAKRMNDIISEEHLGREEEHKKWRFSEVN